MEMASSFYLIFIHHFLQSLWMLGSSVLLCFSVFVDLLELCIWKQLPAAAAGSWADESTETEPAQFSRGLWNQTHQLKDAKILCKVERN